MQHSQNMVRFCIVLMFSRVCIAQLKVLKMLGAFDICEWCALCSITGLQLFLRYAVQEYIFTIITFREHQMSTFLMISDSFRLRGYDGFDGTAELS